MSGKTFVHGTYTGYHTYGCKCGPCREANAAYNRGVRERLAAERRDIEHGTESSYVNHRCRCVDCTDSATAARRERERLAA